MIIQNESNFEVFFHGEFIGFFETWKEATIALRDLVWAN